MWTLIKKSFHLLHITNARVRKFDSTRPCVNKPYTLGLRPSGQQLILALLRVCPSKRRERAARCHCHRRNPSPARTW